MLIDVLCDLIEPTVNPHANTIALLRELAKESHVELHGAWFSSEGWPMAIAILAIMEDNQMSPVVIESHLSQLTTYSRYNAHINANCPGDYNSVRLLCMTIIKPLESGEYPIDGIPANNPAKAAYAKEIIKGFAVTAKSLTSDIYALEELEQLKTTNPYLTRKDLPESLCQRLTTLIDNADRYQWWQSNITPTAITQHAYDTVGKLAQTAKGILADSDLTPKDLAPIPEPATYQDRVKKNMVDFIDAVKVATRTWPVNAAIESVIARAEATEKTQTHNPPKNPPRKYFGDV